ncbi:ABC transporter ATP-binding protein [Sagittula stellata]|uniref:Peptide/opine/nickel uptake family ABC transporter, ATP-binding protein n=1 Tax=Sagittula stellata (strain ATCC 700073 / DSM 11524 / E-37) TaxID=388399 RepID=A3JXN6_SAGS3|nr:ABC transporter ATP-binding protein [Sagittula stellata]EBA10272.1 peptide/opine/nickel uptake family ABC transporter, ATP-binding protein [Sagittula stellata E-37]
MPSSWRKYPRGDRGAEPPAGRVAEGGPNPLLKVDGLTAAIHGKQVLQDITFHMDSGETLALTGESGSGKSLTALAVMGLLPGSAVASGRIGFGTTDLARLGDRDLRRIRGREIGMIFQEPMTALNPLQTIGHQIAEVFRIHGAVPPEMTGLLERVGLDVSPGRYPHELSGGQRQRVVIAMAIALKPRLLIADEPTTALDVTTQARILDLLKDLARTENMALLLITHDLAVVADMADRIAVMQHGRVVETAPTAQLLHRPQHAYTRELIAASSHRAHLPARQPGAPLLRVTDVSVIYPLPRSRPSTKPRSFTAVDNVSFTIRKGERLGLVGESGCGKSTLTRALLGLQPLASGRIEIDGKPVLADGRPSRETQRRIQVVFQDPYGSFNPRHRVARLISEPFHLLDTPPPRDAVAEALIAVGLSPEDASKHIHAFSGGQRQRLAIARALIIRPELIVFDEAVSALDVRVRAQVLDLLARLSDSHGLTWLFISHDLQVVRSVTDRVMVMRNGQIVEDAPTETLFTAPKTDYARRLLAAAPRLPDGLPDGQSG